MQHPKISRTLLVQKINGSFKFDGKGVALVAAAHAVAFFAIISMPEIRSIHPMLPFIPIALLFAFVAYKAKGMASGFICCPECKKPLGIVEMKIALASESCCLCGKQIVATGEADAPNAA